MTGIRRQSSTFRRGTSGENSSRAILRPWVGHEQDLWMALDARLGVEVDANGGVTRWNDQGPAGNHQGQALAPIRPKQSSFQGRASVLCADLKSLESVNPQGTPSGDSATIIVVADFKMTAANSAVWDLDVAMVLESNDPQGQFRMALFGLVPRIIHTSKGYAPGIHMVTVSHETTISRVYVDGERDGVSSLGVEGIGHTWRMYVGKREVAPQRYFDSHIYSLLVWHRRLPETELQYVQSKLKTAWNIA